MCGLVAKSGVVPAVAWYAALSAARARGPHSYGWAGRSGSGWVTQRGPGPLRRPGAPLATSAAGMGTVIGHSRLATSSSERGGLPDPHEGQPILPPPATEVPAGGWLMAHNGSSLHPALTNGQTAPEDTRGLLALAMEEGITALADPRLHDLYDGAPHALLIAYGPTLYALRVDGTHRRAHPLYSARFPDGWLLSSAPAATESELLPPGTLVSFSMIGEAA